MLRHFALCLALAAAAAVACNAPAKHVQTATASPAPLERGTVASNVRRADYAGSAACADCHPAIAESFARSPMHGMTRLAGSADIKAPFDGTAFHFKGDTVTLEARNGKRFMRVDSRATGSITYEITRVIGGRVREDFAGVPILGGEERVLPVSWLIAPKRLRYKGYSVMIEERAGLREGAVWNQTCIFCHNTSPYLLTMLGTLAGPRAPAYQGPAGERSFPPGRRFELEVTDEAALASAVKNELMAFGANAPAAPRKRMLLDAIVATRSTFKGEHLIETGIGCEACHGGSREHVQNPGKHPSLRPVGTFFRVAGQPSHADDVNHVCARCHQVLFSRYPWTWEGGKRDSVRAGGSNINSGEARDMLLGACRALACTACHDPHQRGGGRVRELDTSAGNDVCTSCHAAYATKSALAAHAHHDPDGPGGACVACHMPKKNMSLSSGLTRYHRIGSPTDPNRVMLDRPLECALCHADKSVEQVASDMERLFGKRYERETLRLLYGDLDQNVMIATLERGKPHEQAVALRILGERKSRPAAPLVARALAHPYPLVREYARAALDEIVGLPCDVDITAPAREIASAAEKCMHAAHMAPDPRWTSPAPAELPNDEVDDGED